MTDEPETGSVEPPGSSLELTTPTLALYVIDTSVALRWFLTEPGSREARLYLEQEFDLHAPDLLPIEAAHALVKRTRFTDTATRISTTLAQEISASLRSDSPIEFHPSGPLLELAMPLAIAIGASV